MKITKRQLRRIIKEELGRAALGEMHDVPPGEQHDVGYKDWVSPEHPSKEDDNYEDDEYERGYQDGFDGIPTADSATTAYDAGYEDGSSDFELPGPDHLGRPPAR